MSNPIQPLQLPAPPVVYQTTQITCWAACFRSMIQASGSSANPMLQFASSEQTLLARFSSFMRPGGIATRGLELEAHTLGASVRATSGHEFSLASVRDGLENGYVLLGFVFPHPHGTSGVGHVVVVYGVTPNGVQVMNPNPAGPTFLSRAFLRSCPRVLVMSQMMPGIGHVMVNPFAGMTAH